MFRSTIVPLVILAVVVCCMGQTFQYSRGWTNGKRSIPHFHEDPVLSEIMEIDTEKRLEKCLLTLQHLARTNFALHFPINGRLPGHHQSNEIYEDLNGDQPDLIKKQISSMA